MQPGFRSTVKETSAQWNCKQLVWLRERRKRALNVIRYPICVILETPLKSSPILLLPYFKPSVPSMCSQDADLPARPRRSDSSPWFPLLSVSALITHWSSFKSLEVAHCPPPVGLCLGHSPWHPKPSAPAPTLLPPMNARHWAQHRWKEQASHQRMAKNLSHLAFQG